MKNYIPVALLMMVAPLAVAGDDSQGSARLSTVHHSVMIENYNAIESESLRISLNDGLSGFIEGKVCDSCKEIRVTITPQTKAYENRAEVPLKRAESRIGRYATVIYEVKTKWVSEIRW